MQKGSFLSRMAALLLLVSCVLLVWVLVVGPVQQAHRNFDALIADATAQQQRFTEKRADIRRLDKQLKNLEQARTSEANYLPEQSASLAAAALLGRIKQIIQKHGGTLASSQVLPDSAKPEIPSVTVRAQMKASPQALQQILYQLESEQPSLFLDKLSITKQTRRKRIRRGRKVQQSWDEFSLDVRLDVTGYLKGKVPG